jgi:iron complex outermembrane recepter protein
MAEEVKRKQHIPLCAAGLNHNKQMFKSFFSTAIVLLSVHLYAQEFSISGVIVDSRTNQPLSGATVQAQQANRFAVADEFGRFRLMRLPSGDETLVVRFLGYTEHREDVSINKNLDLRIALEESVRVTDEVLVFSTRASEKTPTTYTTLNRQAIQKQNFGQDLPFLLSWTPSAVTTSDAGTGVGYTGIRIRGSDATSINVTINGIPYNDSESLGTFWVDIPDIASSTQSIQIQRGVGTSTNGGGAFGATINLQTNVRNDELYAELINAYGSFNTRRHTLSFGSGLLNNHWVIDGRVSRIASDGFVDRATADLHSYYFSAGFYSGKTMVKAITFGGKERTYQSWYGVPESRLRNNVEAMYTTAINEGWNETQLHNLLNSNNRTFNVYTYPNQVDDYRQDHYQLHLSQQLYDGLTGNVSLHYTPGKGFFEEYRYNDRLSNYRINPVTIGDSTITRTDLIRRRWLDNHFYGLTYAFNFEKQKLATTLGGAWNRYEGDHYGQLIWARVSPVPHEYRYYFNAADKQDFNVFLKTNYQFSDLLNGYVDVQYRHVTYTANGVENRGNIIDVGADLHFFNPKIGVVFTPNDQQQLYASFAVANREPVRADFINAPTNRLPRHETLQNIEAGYRLLGHNFLLNANYYLMLYNNQLVPTGQVNDVGASLRTNVDNSYRTGIELEGVVKLSPQVTWSANATLSRNKIRSFTEVLYDYGLDFDDYQPVERTYSNTDIAFSPNIIAGSGLSYRPVKGLEATLLSKYVGKQYLDNTSNVNRTLDAYFVNDLRLIYTTQPRFTKEIAFSILVNNIFNEMYESNGYTWGFLGGGTEFRENYYFPQAGRNFLGMITLKF